MDRPPRAQTTCFCCSDLILFFRVPSNVYYLSFLFLFPYDFTSHALPQFPSITWTFGGKLDPNPFCFTCMLLTRTLEYLSQICIIIKLSFQLYRTFVTVLLSRVHRRRNASGEGATSSLALSGLVQQPRIHGGLSSLHIEHSSMSSQTTKEPLS